MLFVVIIAMLANSAGVGAYKHEYTVAKLNDDEEMTTCTSDPMSSFNMLHKKRGHLTPLKYAKKMKAANDPYKMIEDIIHNFLFGMDVDKKVSPAPKNETTFLHHPVRKITVYPTGSFFHAETFDSHAGVHMVDDDTMLHGRSRLTITKDFMQTAVNAFCIILYGNLTDMMNLPSDYVLRSARTISMMKISREKLAETWKVVKNGTETYELTHEFLELYRPLFKYVNAKEMTRLNLFDTRILNYVGTHPDLNRHQIGVVASKYIRMNRKWYNPKYLNLMNNLLCGIPITNMRKITDDTYLQLSHQVFIHIRACEPLQRRFFLARMTRPQALGKSYSWSAGDITRLGLLLAEVSGKHLRSINPEAMSGITSQVMMEMLPENLLFLTTQQTLYIDQKPLNILARKLKFHRDKVLMYGSASIFCIPRILVWAISLVIIFPILKTWNE